MIKTKEDAACSKLLFNTNHATLIKCMHDEDVLVKVINEITEEFELDIDTTFKLMANILNIISAQYGCGGGSIFNEEE